MAPAEAPETANEEQPRPAKKGRKGKKASAAKEAESTGSSNAAVIMDPSKGNSGSCQ